VARVLPRAIYVALEALEVFVTYERRKDRKCNGHFDFDGRLSWRSKL